MWRRIRIHTVYTVVFVLLRHDNQGKLPLTSMHPVFHMIW